MFEEAMQQLLSCSLQWIDGERYPEVPRRGVGSAGQEVWFRGTGPRPRLPQGARRHCWSSVQGSSWRRRRGRRRWLRPGSRSPDGTAAGPGDALARQWSADDSQAGVVAVFPQGNGGAHLVELGLLKKAVTWRVAHGSGPGIEGGRRRQLHQEAVADGSSATSSLAPTSPRNGYQLTNPPSDHLAQASPRRSRRTPGSACVAPRLSFLSVLRCRRPAHTRCPGPGVGRSPSRPRSP